MSPIETIQAMDKVTINADQAAEVLGCNANSIRQAARQRPELLGFPTIIIGHRVLIPRLPFLRALLGKEETV